jgi:FkbM family methyltransferase
MGQRLRPKFDLVELSLIVIFVAFASWRLGSTTGSYVRYSEQTTRAEQAELQGKYGPHRFSEHDEEWIARDFFQDRRGGVFVDIGASHYRDLSNTYYLEHSLGWSGVAVDPQEGFAADYARYRPRTRFFSLFVSDASNETAMLYVNARNSLWASARRDFTAQVGPGIKETKVRTITLDDLLDAAGLKHIDYLSIDVELSEPKVLAGFDIDRFRPALVCIEAHPQVRQQILDYFARHRYVVVARYLRVDTDNLYFEPLQ